MIANHFIMDQGYWGPNPHKKINVVGVEYVHTYFLKNEKCQTNSSETPDFEHPVR